MVKKNSELNSYINDLEKDNKDLRENFKDLQVKFEELNKECAVKQKQIEELKVFANAQRELKALKKENQDFKTALLSLESEIEIVNKDLREKESLIIKLQSEKSEKFEYVNQACISKTKELEAELENKLYDFLILSTEKERIFENFLQYQKINENYVMVINELKEKLKDNRLKEIENSYRENLEKISEVSEDEHLNVDILDILPDESKNSFEKKISQNDYEIIIRDLEDQLISQKIEHETEILHLSSASTVEDFSAFTSCMCSALEEIFNSQIYQS